MFAKIKIALAAGAAVIMAILYALLQKEKAGRAEDDLAGEQAKSGVERKATSALTEGLENESTTDKPSDRGRFT